jgi:hypothetical protein
LPNQISNNSARSDGLKKVLGTSDCDLAKSNALIGRFLGLDVHAETIAVAVAEQDGEVRSLGVIANRAESVRKLIKKLGPAEQLRACYEAGPTG